jgi:hypothetical protein
MNTHGSTTIIQEQEQQHTLQPPTVPRSIVRSRKHTNNETNGTMQQWPTSPTAHQQQTTSTSTNHGGEERTVMSNLSPDNSAMMTNVSWMVETLGSVVTTLAKESANTNDTIKQMNDDTTNNNNEQPDDANGKKHR